MEERLGARRSERKERPSGHARNGVEPEGRERLRRTHVRHHWRGGRRHPCVAMIRVVIGRIRVADVRDDPVMRGVRVRGMMVVDEVPESGERLDRDEHRDQEYHDDAGPIHDRRQSIIDP